EIPANSPLEPQTGGWQGHFSIRQSGRWPGSSAGLQKIGRVAQQVVQWRRDVDPQKEDQCQEKDDRNAGAKAVPENRRLVWFGSASLDNGQDRAAHADKCDAEQEE